MLPPSESLTPNQWMVRLGKLAGADQIDPAKLPETLGEYAAALREEFAASVFTAESARQVARRANNRGFFPTYAQVCEALRTWAKENPARAYPKPALQGGDASAIGNGPWMQFIARRLGEGGDREHLRSLAKRYAGAELPEILRRLFADGDASPTRGAEEYPRAEVERTVAKLIGHPPDRMRAIHAQTYLGQLRRFAPDLAAEFEGELLQLTRGVREPETLGQALGKVLRMQPRKVPGKPQAPTAGPAPPMDPHSPPAEVSWADLKRQLAKLEIEAATPDPPPNAAARIARLRETLGRMEAGNAA